MILPKQTILKRVIDGMDEGCCKKLIDKLQLSSDIINIDKLAEEILNLEKSKRIKFNDIYNQYLSKEHIDELFDKYKKLKNSNQAILFSNFDITNLQPANYDLRLGEECYVTEEERPLRLAIGETISIKPGEFGILTTHEYIYVPMDLMGLISLRFRYKRQGLVNISGFHIDPGYCGRIIFSVYNTGPKSVLLRSGDPVFMIIYDKLENQTIEGYEGDRYLNIPVDIISSLKGPSVSILDLDK